MGLLSSIRTLRDYVFHRQRVEREMEEEFRSHIESRAEDLRRKGLSKSEAERQARVEFGSYQNYKEECREALGTRLLEELAQDVRYGLRQLRRNPGFTVVAVLTLALGIGANTAIFGVVNAVMLKMLPVKNPEQLVRLSWVSQEWPTDLLRGSDPLMRDTTGRWIGQSFPYPSFEEFQRDNSVFSSFFGFNPFASVNISAGSRANVAEEELVTGGYFSGLGVVPAQGRFIDREDEKVGAPGVAVISYGLWSRYFGRSPAAVGKTITIDGVLCTVIGVAPPRFFGVTPGRAVDVWVPLVQDTRLLPPILLHMPRGSSPFTSKTSWWVEMMGRLKPGVSAQEAQAQLEVLFEQSRRGLNVSAKPQSIPHIQLESGAKGLASLREEFSTPLRILTVIVGIVLLIACANVAALLLARSAARQQEIALRLSLGVSRARLVRQLLTESVLLAGLGGAVGVLFAYWASHALLLLMSNGGQQFDLRVLLDARVLGFTAALSILTGFLFGLAPELRSMRVDLTPPPKGGTGGASLLSKQRARMGLARSLIATQVALALMLSIGAGLFVRTLEALEGQNIGFDQHHLLLFTVNPARNGYEGERLMDFYARLQGRLWALPGVKSATMSMERPVYGNEWNVNVPVSVVGYKAEPGQSTRANWNTVGPSFFKTLGIPLMMGRSIELSDTAASPKVVVVNEAFAREAFGGRNPTGHRVRFPFSPQSHPEFEIVGMVQDSRYASLRVSPWPTIYIPYTQLPTMLGALNFELKTTGDPSAVIPAVRGVVRDLDPDLPISDVRTQTQQIAETLVQERLFGKLSSFFAGLAVLLSCVGLYGVISYSISQRTHEIGIRMALGAEKMDVLKMVIGQGLKLALIGVVIGIAGALALTRFLSSLLYGVKPTDPLTFIAVSFILIAVALVACYIPAHRAAKVDPMVVLRHE